MHHGIDISQWKNVVNWPAVRDNGISFCSTKITQGDYYTNPAAGAQVEGARGVGIFTGGFHFGDPDVPVAANVAHFMGHALGFGVLNTGSLLPMLDIENSPNDNIFWNAATANPFVTEFIRIFREESGVAEIAVYANLDFYRNILRPDEWADDAVTLWLANYNGDPGRTDFTHRRLGLHQHTEEGAVPGVEGHVDRNVTLDGIDLDALTIGHLPPPLPCDVPAQRGRTIRVEPGMCLSVLAEQYGVSVEAIVAANPIIRDRDHIEVGWDLVIPAA
ncbi:hypothetical protein GCM10010174_03300 [Kutzneria viridogrisea]|uniref:GH25 family lysozyme M1 (1,4-beta-N-acetylmuramidase) n=1 Tax=Kutzneria viridogrisea TaxID=47990 RepID=A0ABR6BS10_9PSEU|nr:GH25 family lysozyme M1 (1,4-beta-N-acetylmuramidase) [Kutzneria viridogrisea]